MSNCSFRQYFNLPHDVSVRINATNVCNIHCTHCDNDAHLPFSKNGNLIYRRKPLVADVADIEEFCHLMDGVGQDDPHILTGGEITVLPVQILVDYIDVLHRHGRKVGMRTNGYNVLGIPLDKLNLLDRIHLNSHGVNEKAITVGRAFLDEHYCGQIIPEATLQHRDLKSIVRHGEGTIEKALACNHLMATLTLLPPVVLPCCNTWALMNSLNSNAMMAALVEAGWTVRNPGLKETLNNWRQTLPRDFLHSFCADSCYMTRSTHTPLYPIEVHPRDRALKRIPIASRK